MSAVTRWVQYDISEAGVIGTGGGTNWGRGTRGYSFATAAVDDSFNIGTTNNRLYITMDGTAPTIGVTLASGVELDPRFVAKDISEAMHNAGQAVTAWDQAQCVWDDNQFKLYSGTLGSSSSITVWSGTNTAHLELGWGTRSELGGSVNNSTGSPNGNTDNYVTVSGVYNGFFDETYTIVISKEVSIGTPSKGGTNSYTGTLTTGGFYNWATTISYNLIISTTNGTTMGAGTGNVPILTWESTGNVDDNLTGIELLYADYWYKLGTKGMMIKLSDAIFNTCDPAWTIVGNQVIYAEGTNATAPIGTAQFVWGSSRGDDADTAYATSTGWTRLGSRGMSVKFTAPTVANLAAKDEFFIVCTPPQPSAYDITNLNYGNVTVSTEAPVRNVIFEIMSGAVEIDTVKFGLQSHGNFEHHGEGNNDTYFRFGTVGPGNPKGTPPQDGYEWRTNVTASDISSDTPPSYLYATQENLAVVADADSSQAIGTSVAAGMVADPIWLNIKLGASEVGANSTINYRIYFDYA
jgi:hypothetical protein